MEIDISNHIFTAKIRKNLTKSVYKQKKMLYNVCQDKDPIKERI